MIAGEMLHAGSTRTSRTPPRTTAQSSTAGRHDLR